MADGYLNVQPDLIRRSGGGIRSAAQRLRAELEAFQGELAGFGEPWGDDDIGSLIGGCYQAVYEVAMECYTDNIGEMENEADGVNTMAATYYQAESSTEVEVNKVRDILG
jgi:hypothetical protein